MRLEGRMYNADNSVNRIGLTYTWPVLDRHARSSVRRSYRWLRERDVSPTIARLVLDSSMSAMRDSMRMPVS